MLASTLTIHTRQGAHIPYFLAPREVIEAGVVNDQAVEAARVLGHLNVALSGYPWSPCRQLIVFNQERQ